MAGNDAPSFFDHRLRLCILTNGNSRAASFVAIETTVSPPSPKHQESSNLATSQNDILTFLINFLLGFLQLKFQAKDQSPFESHPKTTGFALATFFAYSLTYAYERMFLSTDWSTTRAKVTRCCLSLLGSFTVASTASLLIHDSVRPLLYVICVVILAWDWLLSYWSKVFSKGFFVNILWRLRRQTFGERGEVLPLIYRINIAGSSSRTS